MSAVCITPVRLLVGIHDSRPISKISNLSLKSSGGMAYRPVSDVGKFVTYLRSAVPKLLEDAEDTPKAFSAALYERAVVDCMRRFLGDPQVAVLLVQRHSAKGSCTDSE